MRRAAAGRRSRITWRRRASFWRVWSPAPSTCSWWEQLMRTVWATRAPSATLSKHKVSSHLTSQTSIFLCVLNIALVRVMKGITVLCIISELVFIYACASYFVCGLCLFEQTSHQPVKEWTMGRSRGNWEMLSFTSTIPQFSHRLLSESSGLWVPPYFLLKRQCTQKWKFCHLLLTLMSFQTRKPFVYLRNTNEDIFDEIWAFWACIDSNATDTFKAQKCSKNIVKIVHVKKKIFKNSSDFIKNILIWDRNLKKGLTGLEGE